MAAALAAPVVMGIASAIAGGMATYAQNKKLAKQYKQSAEEVRNAAKEYSGGKADSAMNQEGYKEARRMANMQNFNNPLTSNLSMQNAIAGANDANASISSAAQSGLGLGRSNKATELNSKYNQATAKAQRDLKQAGVDYNVGQQTMQGVANTAGGLVDMYKDIRSDERAKEYDNHSNLPKADVDDAFRQIESIEYKYKDGMGPQDGKHVGTTAQSWEGTVFDDAVKENEEGIKELDKNKMLEAGLAGVASLRKDVDKMITSDERCKEVENIIESNPKEAANVLPDNSLIQKEAEQVTDGNPQNSEVRNDVVEDFVTKEPGSFMSLSKMFDNATKSADDIVYGEDDWLSFGKKPKRTRAEAKQAKQDALDELDRLSTADMREISEMGGTANPYSPDLSSSNPSAYGDDYKALAETVGNIIDGTNNVDGEQSDALPPAVIDASLPVESDVADTSEYNFDWAYEVLPDEDKEEFAAVPDEEKAEWLKLHGFTIGGGGPISTPSGAISPESDVELNNNRTAGASFGKMFNMSTPSGGISASSSPSTNVSKAPEQTDIKSGIHGSADLPDTPNETAAVVIGAKQGTENNGNLTANGVYNSGAVNHTGSSLKASTAKLPNGESRGQSSNDIDLEEATIENIKRRVAELPVGLAEALGFTDTTYKGIKFEDADLNEADKVLSNLGV